MRQIRLRISISLIQHDTFHHEYEENWLPINRNTQGSVSWTYIDDAFFRCMAHMLDAEQRFETEFLFVYSFYNNYLNSLHSRG